MRLWGLILVVGALLAACDPPGLTLEITAFDLPVKRVELFVGESCDGICPRAVAPPGLAMRATDIFLVDDQEPWSAPVVDGIAGFRLWADDDRTVPIIVAIGFDALEGGSPIATAATHHAPISVRQSQYWQLPLVTAPVISDAETPVDGYRVMLWERLDRALPACVMVEKWSSGNAARNLVVPRTDKDCDQLPAGECAPFTPLAMASPATIDNASCVLVTQTAPVPFCKLGGATCSETGGQSQPCARLEDDYCVPYSFCSCGPWGEDCIEAVIKSPSGSVPNIWCDLPLTAAGDSCANLETRMTVMADELLTDPRLTCVAARVNDVSTPLGAFGTTVMIDGGGVLDVFGFTGRCTFQVKWTERFTQAARTEPLLVELELSNGKHMVIPFGVALAVDKCATVMPGCFVYPELDSGDTTLKCAQPPPAPTYSCEAVPGCNGPKCGAGCCGAGEYCDPVSSTCRCGSYTIGCSSPYECVGTVPNRVCGSACCVPNTSPLMCAN